MRHLSRHWLSSCTARTPNMRMRSEQEAPHTSPAAVQLQPAHGDAAPHCCCSCQGPRSRVGRSRHGTRGLLAAAGRSKAASGTRPRLWPAWHTSEDRVTPRMASSCRGLNLSRGSEVSYQNRSH